MVALISLEVENIRSVKKASIKFTRGVNFIHGANGVGKTTILDSIAIALFGTDWLKRRRMRLADLVTIGALQSVVRLRVEVDGSIYVIQRAFNRDKMIESLTYVVDESGRRLAARDRDVTRWVMDKLNIDPATFELLYIRQGELRTILEVNKREELRLDKVLKLEALDKLQDVVLRNIAKRLEYEENATLALLKEARDELSGVEKSINDARARLEGVNRQIKDLEARLSQVKEAQARLEDEERRLISDRERLKALEQALAEAIKELEEVRARRISLEEEAKKASEAEARLRLIEGALSSYDRLRARREELVREINELNARLSQLEVKEAMANELKRRLKDLEEIRLSLRQELEEAEEAQAELSRLNVELKRVSREASRLSELESERASLEAELRHLGEELELLESSREAKCPVCGRPLSSGDKSRLVESIKVKVGEVKSRLSSIEEELAKAREAREIEQEIMVRVSQLQAIAGRISDLRDRLSSIEEQLRSLKEQIKEIEEEVKDLEPIRERVRALNEELNKVNGELNELDRLRDEYVKLSEFKASFRIDELAKVRQSEEALEARVNSISREVEDLRARVSRLSEVEAELAKVKEEASRLEAQVNQLRGVKTQLEAIIKDYEARKASLSQRISERVKAIEDVRARRQALMRIVKAVNDAKPILRKMLLDAVNSELKEVFKAIRRKEALVDIYLTEDYEVMVRRVDGREIPVDMLSMGERSLIALVLRFALVKALLGQIPLMLLDEPTEHLDSEHRRSIANWLKDLSDSVGTLIVTSHVDAFENIADNVIRVELMGQGLESIAYNA